MTASTRLKGESWDRIAETLRVLDECGVTPEHLARIRNDRFFAHEVGAHIQQHSLKEPIYHNMIRNKFPQGHFFGVAEWQRVFNAQFTPTEIGSISQFPWDSEYLKSPDRWSPRETVAQTHFAFLGVRVLRFRTSLEETLGLEMWNLNQLVFRYQSGSRMAGLERNVNMVFEPEVAREQMSYCEFRWFLARFCPVPVGDPASYEEEIDLLSGAGYQMAWPVEAVMARILAQASWIASGFGAWHDWARTRSMVPAGRVCIRSEGPDTILVSAVDNQLVKGVDKVIVLRKRPTQE